MSDISLYLDQDNELKFSVAIEGSRMGSPKYRLVFEGNNFSYAFNGRSLGNGEVTFTIPKMKNLMREGSYQAELEVMVDDRFFKPLAFSADFEESIKVTAEAFVKPVAKKPVVSASIVASNTSTKPIVESTQQREYRSTRKTLELDSSGVGEIDGKRVSVDDLRALIRTRR